MLAAAVFHLPPRPQEESEPREPQMSPRAHRWPGLHPEALLPARKQKPESTWNGVRTKHNVSKSIISTDTQKRLTPPSIRLGKRAQETRRRSEPSQQDGEHLRAHRKPQPRPTGHRGGVCPMRPRARGCLLPPVPVRVARKVLASAGSQGDRAGIHTEEKGEPLFPEAMHSPTESSNGSSVVQQSSGKM